MTDPASPRSGDRLAAAEQLTIGWPPGRARLAISALGLSDPDVPRRPLEQLASEAGVSRETVRRARNALSALLEAESAPGLPAGMTGSTAAGAPTQRALRRVLTLTGPMRWDETLTAWARAGGRAPYLPLPADAAALESWVERDGGLTLAGRGAGTAFLGVASPEPLDRVGKFFRQELGGRTAGVGRSELFLAAGGSGLTAATVATALSSHPAVRRLGRGNWGLRGTTEPSQLPYEGVRLARQVPRPRARPTAFEWAPGGELEIEFSLPQGPSPVVAVPKAVAEVLEGGSFASTEPGPPATVTVRGGRAWGFAPLLPGLGADAGDRLVVSVDLLAGTAALRVAGRRETA